MQQAIDLGIFIIGLLAIVGLLFLVYKMKVQKSKLQSLYAQAVIDRGILLEKVSTLAAEKDANDLKDDNGFIKFLSQSRDYAYQYIEEVQGSVQEFKSKVDPIIKNIGTNEDSNVKSLIEAYNDLVQILPKDESTTVDQKEK